MPKPWAKSQLICEESGQQTYDLAESRHNIRFTFIERQLIQNPRDLFVLGAILTSNVP